jgi:hypothetical protein
MEEMIKELEREIIKMHKRNIIVGCGAAVMLLMFYCVYHFGI